MSLSFKRTVLPASKVASLCWRGDELVDWVRGGTVYRLDGTVEERGQDWGFQPDEAVAVEDGSFAAVYEQFGTRGLLLREGQPLRALQRVGNPNSGRGGVFTLWRGADGSLLMRSGGYPICLWRGPGGRVLLAHCPRGPTLLELEDAETGRCLSAASTEHAHPYEYTHANLAVNRSGTRLLSAGWTSYPWFGVVHFDVEKALRDPRHLNQLNGTPETFYSNFVEQVGACWLTDEHVVISGAADPFEVDPEDMREHGLEFCLQPGGIEVYDVAHKRVIGAALPDRAMGEMMAVGEQHVIAFFGHPRLIRVATGRVEHEWLEFKENLPGPGVSSDEHPPRRIAMDPRHRRFAVADSQTITVIQLPAALGPEGAGGPSTVLNDEP